MVSSTWISSNPLLSNSLICVLDSTLIKSSEGWDVVASEGATEMDGGGGNNDGGVGEVVDNGG